MQDQIITFEPLSPEEDIPYELLLLADPAKEVIDDYLTQSVIYVAKQQGATIGVLVLLSLSPTTLEIKNLAVQASQQGQGIGQFMIEKAVQVARQKGYESICIGTANSSIGPLYLYQKLGFDLTEIKRHFFIQHYPEPIYENGIQAKHLLILSRSLVGKSE